MRALGNPSKKTNRLTLLLLLSAMASPPPPRQLHIVGLCDEAIVVDWHDDDTVLAVKTKAFDAAASTILPDGSRHSLVNGVTLPQLCLVLERRLMKTLNPHLLEDDSVLSQLLPHHLRLAFLGLGLYFKRGFRFCFQPFFWRATDSCDVPTATMPYLIWWTPARSGGS